MRGWRSGWPGLLLVAGCIPHVAPPAGYPGTRPAPDVPPPNDRRRPPAAADRPSRSDSDATAEANRASLQQSNDLPPPAPAPMRTPRPQRSPDDGEPTAPPAARPAWEAKDVPADAAEVADGSITVQRGDTLRSLGERTGVGGEALARANDLAPAADLRAGKRLRVPGGRYHLVRSGQAGIAIARSYGVPWSAIVDANHFTEPYILHVGQRILIPGAAAPSSSAAARAAAFSLNIDDILTGGEPALATNQAPAQPIATPTRVLPPSAAVVEPARLRGSFVLPAEGRLVKRFGHGESGERNDGIEIALPVNTPVKAAADGVVAYAGEGIAALGGLVIVRHGDGWTTVYGHANKLLVQRGQSVRRGQTIALSGDTGFADRPELHFEMRKGRTPVDPQSQLPGL